MHASRDQPAGSSLALIIATSSYADPTLTSLRAPGQDARDLADVLGDEAIGGYHVETVIDETVGAIQHRVAQFCSCADLSDLVLVYLSCHSLLDERGQLHFAATDTKRERLAATAIDASWLRHELDVCRSRRKILILDCCHSAAFAHDATGGTAEIELALHDRFHEGQSLAVLTASRATEYAFEGDRVIGEGAHAVFTSALVNGLRSGDADRDGDGLIGVTELFDYAHHAVRAGDGRQHPGLWVHAGEGKLVVARNSRGPRIETRHLPDDLVLAVESAQPAVRIGAVAALADLFAGPDPRRALAARDRLEHMAAHDIPSVAQAAREALELHRPPGEPPHKASRPLSPPPEHAPSRLRWPLVAAIVLVLGAITSFAILSGDQPATVKIGSIYSLTGVNREAGRDALDGARLALDYINGGDYPDVELSLAAGEGLPRLDGAKLKLVEADPSSNRCSGQPAFDRLVKRDRVAAVIGAYESTVTLQALIAADRRHVPLVNESATAPSLTEPGRQPRGAAVHACGATKPDPRPSPWFFRVGPSDAQAASLFFALIDEARRSGRIHVRKVAILHENNDLIGNSAAAVIENAKHRGTSFRNFTYRAVQGRLASLPDATCTVEEHRLVKELRSKVRQIQQYDPDVVFAVGYAPDAIMVVQTMQELAYQPPALLAFGGGFVDSGFIRGVRAGNLACGLPRADPTGIIARTSWSPDLSISSHAARQVAELFAQRYGRPMTSRSAGGFTAMLTLAQAINDAGSTDPVKLQAALRALDVPANGTIMPWNGIKFDAHGQNVRARALIQQIIGGRYVVVYPPEMSTSPAIWPLSKTHG
jgi:branched-chain amino acid transport system substrate-binding protein